MIIILGKWSAQEIDAIIKEAGKLKEPGEKIKFISKFFLKTPYRESTLKGGIDKKEELVINFSGVDCFTFIDYVEALRLSRSFEEFPQKLARIRYKDGKIDYRERNHFFTDWIHNNSSYVEDITEMVGGEKTKTVKKILNLKEDGSLFLEGIDIKEREIKYIPAWEIKKNIEERLKTGDYAGIYTETKGLDVSHVGIIIKDKERVLFRHASSIKNMREVTDSVFHEYMNGKDGIIVLRPRSVP